VLQCVAVCCGVLQCVYRPPGGGGAVVVTPDHYQVSFVERPDTNRAFLQKRLPHRWNSGRGLGWHRASLWESHLVICYEVLASCRIPRAEEWRGFPLGDCYGC